MEDEDLEEEELEEEEKVHDEKVEDKDDGSEEEGHPSPFTPGAEGSKSFIVPTSPGATAVYIAWPSTLSLFLLVSLLSVSLAAEAAAAAAFVVNVRV